MNLYDLSVGPVYGRQQLGHRPGLETVGLRDICCLQNQNVTVEFLSRPSILKYVPYSMGWMLCFEGKVKTSYVLYGAVKLQHE